LLVSDVHHFALFLLQVSLGEVRIFFNLGRPFFVKLDKIFLVI
jgi:hypothetical protein